MNEFIYILINEAMPRHIKTERTKNLEQRRLSLNRLFGELLSFKVFDAFKINNTQKNKQWLHSVFFDRRTRNEREFLKKALERIVGVGFKQK